MVDKQDPPADDRSGRLPTSRRALIAAGAGIAGLSLAGCSESSDGDEPETTTEPSESGGGDRTGDHDHGGDALGESEPVSSIDAERLDATTLDATEAAVEALSADRLGAAALSSTHLSIEGTNRVDVVAESEIDHEGDLSAEIRSYLDERDETNHLFVLPEGTYSWNSQFDESVFEFLGIVGAPNATLKIETHDPDYAFQVGSVSGLGEGLAGDQAGKHLLLRNLTVDVTESERHSAGLVYAKIARRGLLENLRLRGRRSWDHADQGAKFTCRVEAVDEEGFATIRNVNLPDGEIENPDTDYRQIIPFSADPPHVGTNVWEGCWVEGWTHGFYVMNNRGRNVLRGCTAKDNGNHNIRLGRNDVCRDSTVILSDASDPERHTPGSALQSYGGSPVAENVTIRAPDAWNRLIWVAGEAQGGTFRDIDVHIGDVSPVNAINVSSQPPLNGRVRFENVSVFDESDGSPHPRHGGGSQYVAQVSNDDVAFRNCFFDGPRGGLVVRGGAPIDGIEIENCRFDVDGEALRFAAPGAEHDVVGNRFGGDVRWDEPLEDVLWTGNRHQGDVVSNDADGWHAADNWGFATDVDQ